ncbi:hypothetical protein V5O48_011198 [Marasmius crinis-equi]|uniref:Uncharacterized protein n=1 Tax=Marasmius crinis-equi TaxID=585013 RepID=A0ABR3F6A0_9AGAR
MNRRQRRQEKAAQQAESTPAQTEIPEEEQWRLINDSGVLQKISQEPKQKTLLEEEAPLANEILDATMYIIPLVSLLLILDILIHNQYGIYPPLMEFAERMATGGPILSIFVFYTKRYQDNRRMKLLIFLLSICVGPRVLYLLAKGSYRVNIRQVGS